MKAWFCGMLLIACAAAKAGCQAAPARQSDTTSSDTIEVEYRDSPVTLPLPWGFRVPSYDRVNGLTIPWGPRLELGDERFRMDGLVAYRSHLGDFDPSVNVRVRSPDSAVLTLFAGRGTFSNDDWIRGNVTNTIASLGVGSDSRNYFRADRAEIKLNPSLQAGAFVVAPMLGARFENDWSTGSLQPTGGPWSVFGRTDTLKMRRPNPPIAKGHISSGLAGLGITVADQGITGKLTATVEHAFRAPVGIICPTPYWITRPAGCFGLSTSAFTQTTLHADVTFPTFGQQRFTTRGHWMLASGGLLPPQRYGYLGGGSTLATVERLAIGGDHLFFAEGDYYVPINRISVPFLGNPYVDLRYAAGNVGIGVWPSLIQNIGVEAGVSYLRAGYTIDPASARSPFSKRSDFSIGLSLTK